MLTRSAYSYADRDPTVKKIRMFDIENNKSRFLPKEKKRSQNILYKMWILPLKRICYGSARWRIYSNHTVLNVVQQRVLDPRAADPGGRTLSQDRPGLRHQDQHEGRQQNYTKRIYRSLFSFKSALMLCVRY